MAYRETLCLMLAKDLTRPVTSPSIKLLLAFLKRIAIDPSFLSFKFEDSGLTQQSLAKDGHVPYGPPTDISSHSHFKFHIAEELWRLCCECSSPLDCMHDGFLHLLTVAFMHTCVPALLFDRRKAAIIAAYCWRHNSFYQSTDLGTGQI